MAATYDFECIQIMYSSSGSVRVHGVSAVSTDQPTAAEFAAVGWSVETAETPWTRTLPLEEYMIWMHSKSYVAAIAELHANAALEQFMADERASLLSAFPDGQIVEPFVTELY